MERITVVITSCNRIELLKKTIDSFNAMNTYPVESFIIVEDSVNSEMHRELCALYPDYTLLINGKNHGLVESIDRAYALVKTPWVFHIEDDYEFIKQGFIEASINVVTNNHFVMQVWLENMNNQPIDTTVLTGGGTPYHYASLDGMDHIWHGFSFHPGLRNMRIYKEIAPWTQWSPKEDFLALRECKIGEEYLRKGYRAAVLTEEYCKHIGGQNSTWNK
jgi:hypothetical protein